MKSLLKNHSPHHPGSKKPGLRVRLAEAEETVRAIRSGEVDAVVVESKQGDRVFTLDGAEHAYRILIESMHEGALTLRVDSMILYANHCFAEMVHCPLEHVIGGSFSRFLSPEDWAALEPLLQQADTVGTKIQVMLNADDASQMPAQISISLLTSGAYGDGGATLGLVVTDLTEARRLARQKETERLYEQAREQAAELERRVEERTEELLHANQELEAFEASVSHDLRSPLRHIASFAELLLEDYDGQFPKEAERYLHRICNNAKDMDRLIAALLEFSHVGKKSLARQPVDVSAMCHEIFEEMQPELDNRIVEVTIGEMPRCVADPILLRQVLINLLGNAIKYSRTRDRAVIEISAVAPLKDGSTVYAIKDNGVGFDMAHAHKLFIPFERLHHAREFEGTGVGLATVQRIIERHGGHIWAESVPDVGTTFFFTVGVPQSDPEAASISE